MCDWDRFDTDIEAKGCSIKTVSRNWMENSMRTRLKENEDNRYLLTDLRIPVRTLYVAIWRW